MTDPPAPDQDMLLAVFDALRRLDPSVLPAGAVAERDGPLLRVIGGRRGFVAAPADLSDDGRPLDADALDALISRQRDHFAARGEAVEWKTYGYDRPDLVGRLLAASFVAEPTETVVLGPAGPLAETAGLVGPAGVVLRDAVDDADLAGIVAMEEQIWGSDRSHLAAELGHRLDSDTSTVVVAETPDGEVVSAGWADEERGTAIASLWGGSTLAPWRRRGIYRALVARRAAWAVGRGCAWLQVDASDDSRPILERLGLLAVTTTTPYVWAPPV